MRSIHFKISEQLLVFYQMKHKFVICERKLPTSTFMVQWLCWQWSIYHTLSYTQIPQYEPISPPPYSHSLFLSISLSLSLFVSHFLSLSTSLCPSVSLCFYLSVFLYLWMTLCNAQTHSLTFTVNFFSFFLCNPIAYPRYPLQSICF